MKRRTVWLIMILEFFVVIGGGLAVKYLPGAVAYWRSSEVYKRYCEVEGVRASYVKDYPVNDTLTIGVTLLEATDSAGWEYLLHAFNIPQEMIEDADSGLDICTWQAIKDCPETRYDSWLSDDSDEVVVEIVSMSIKNQEICIFHTQDKEEQNAVFDKRIEANL